MKDQVVATGGWICGTFEGHYEAQQKSLMQLQQPGARVLELVLMHGVVRAARASNPPPMSTSKPPIRQAQLDSYVEFGQRDDAGNPVVHNLTLDDVHIVDWYEEPLVDDLARARGILRGTLYARVLKPTRGCLFWLLWLLLPLLLLLLLLAFLTPYCAPLAPILPVVHGIDHALQNGADDVGLCRCDAAGSPDGDSDSAGTGTGRNGANGANGNGANGNGANGNGANGNGANANGANGNGGNGNGANGNAAGANGNGANGNGAGANGNGAGANGDGNGNGGGAGTNGSGAGANGSGAGANGSGADAGGAKDGLPPGVKISGQKGMNVDDALANPDRFFQCGQRLTLDGDVLFDHDRSDPKPASIGTLKKVSALLHSHSEKGAVIDVIGHTDFSGSERYNDKLSVRRAQSVAKVLLQDRAVKRDHVHVEGHATREPVVGPDGPQELNRRVEIVVECPR